MSKEDKDENSEINTNTATRYRICDRCKKAFPHMSGTTLNTTAAFFNAFPEQDGPWLIDLCPECKKELHRWIFGDDKVNAEWIDVYWMEPDGHGGCVTRYDIHIKICSHCKMAFKAESLLKRNYCPNCGKKMTKGIND